MKRHALCIIPFFGMIIAGLAHPISLYAQAPQAIAYQAIVRGSDGNVLADQLVSFQITIHKDAAVGPEVYCETHAATTSPLGLVTLEIGNGSQVFGSFEALDWSTGVYFLEVGMDPEGGTAYVALGTTQLLSVPYALYSEKTGQTYQAGSGIDITDEVITNTAPNACHTGDAVGEDVLIVSGIQGRLVSPTEPIMDQVLQWDGSQWSPATLAGASPGWSLTGNSGTDPDMNFLGTTDNQPLCFRVNNQSAGEINPLTYNTFLGRKAGKENTTGSYNIFVGDSTGVANTEGNNNTFLGPWSGTNNTTGENNVFVGADAGENNTTADNNIFIGWGAGFNNETGQENVFVGNIAGATSIDRSNLVAVGYGALCNNGLGATESNQAINNTAVGYKALYSNETGRCNTAIGYHALYDNTAGDLNTATGYQALYNNETGHRNTATGMQALIHNTTGFENTASGAGALFYNTSGNQNVSMGRWALLSNTTGCDNVAIGWHALYSNGDGNNNTVLGTSAGHTSEGSGNVFLGYNAGYDETGSNKLYIANSSTDPPLVYGDFSTGQLGLGTITPKSKIHIVGEDNARIILSSAEGANDLTSELMMKGTFGSSITWDQAPRNIAMVKAHYDDGGWETATLSFHVAGTDCNTDGDTDPCERMRITSGGHVGIGTESPDASAILDLASTSMGFLLPRMTQSQRTAISSPAAGLLVFQTDAPSGYYYYTGTSWVSIEGTGAGAPSSCIDYDGNAYPTFTIGTQVWMAENLRVTHYRNGDAVPNVADNSAWNVLTTGAYCWFGNDEEANAKYGTLYNWYAVDDIRGLCPEGWRVPTDAEWTLFSTYLGGEDVAGGKMKSVSALWEDPNIDATNNSGFSGLPGGYRFVNGAFLNLGQRGRFWSSSQEDTDNGGARSLEYDYAGLDSMNMNKRYGYSVRCLKD